MAILQPRTALAWQAASKTVLRTGFGLFSDILPGSVVDLVGINPPYSKTFLGGLLGTAGGSNIDSAIAATVAANQTFTSGFAQGQLSCASALSNPATCLQPVAITAVPDGKLHAPYFMQWSFALEQQIGTTMNLRAQYVGTRAVNQPYETQVNGYQTVCQGCFAPFPYGQPSDPRFGAVTQLSTGANSHYNGLQLTADKRLTHGLQVLANYTWSRCMDTVSNGGFLPFSAGGILTPLPGRTGAAIRSLRLRCARQFHRAIRLSVAVQGAEQSAGGSGEWMAGVGNGVLAQRRAVFGVEHAVFGERRRHRARERPAICERGRGRSSL